MRYKAPFFPYNEILNEQALMFLEQDKKAKYNNAVVQSKTGDLMVTLKVESSDYYLKEAVREHRSDEFNTFLSSLDENFGIYYSLMRYPVNFEYKTDTEALSGSVKQIENIRLREHEDYKLLQNDCYITVVYYCISKEIMVSETSLSAFIQCVENLISTLININARVSVVKGDDLVMFLKNLVIPHFGSPLMPHYGTPLYKAIDTYDIQINSIPLKISECGTEYYIKTISLNTLPEYTYPDMLCVLYSFPFIIRTCFKFISLGDKKGEEEIRRQKNRFKSSVFSLKEHIKADMRGSDVTLSDEVKHSEVKGKDECEEALVRMSMRDEKCGYFTGIIVVYALDESECEKQVEEIRLFLSKIGFLTKRESYGNALLFYTSLPLFNSSFRSHLMLSSNVSDMLTLSSPYKGAIKSALLIKRTASDIPLLILKNHDSSPYFFSLSGTEGEKGHTLISGPTGCGKSIFLSMLAASFLKYGNTRVVIIDRDLSSLNIVQGNNGEIIYPMVNASRFCPLSTHEQDLKDNISFLKAIADTSGVFWNAEIEKNVITALSLLDSSCCTLSIFYAVLKGCFPKCELLKALIKFIPPLSYIFEAPANTLTFEHRITLIETNKFLESGNANNNIALPLMIHILSSLDKILTDSKPTLFIMDEGWKLLKNMVFKEYFEEWIKTLRKKNTDIVFSVTNLSDITDKDIAETVLSNTETRVFMADKSANESIQKQKYLSMGLTEEDVNIIARAPKYHCLILNDGTKAFVNADLSPVLEYLYTTDDMKKELLCKLS
ncbi:MAG: hypothetical protein SOZ83_02885 [Sphaerochaetaceae bacterium]|nr:hypothetical protein [Sphaerochaetaceae bacterium]